MCDPTTLAVASFAMGAVGQYSQYSAQSAQAAAQNNAYEQNRINALASMREDYKQLNTRQMQEAESASLEAQKRQAQAQRELATARVGAGEAGISGLSVEGILRDISGLALNDTDAINRGADWNINQIQAEKSGVRSSTQGRISSQSRGSKSSPWTLGLGIAGAGIDAYTGYANRTGKDPLAPSS